MSWPENNYAFDIRGFGAGQTSSATGSNYIFVQPRPKYTFFAFFEINTEVQPDWYQEAVKNGRCLAALSSIGHPAVEFDTVTLRSYNGYRVVPLKVKYKPITIKLRDDSPSFVANLLKSYRSHYHNSGDAESRDDFGDTLPGIGARGGSLDSIGLKNKTTRHFFNRIIIYDLGTSPSSVNVYYLINPMITSIDHGELDYNETNGLVDIGLTIEYEGYYEELGKTVTDYADAFAQIQASASTSGSNQIGGNTSTDFFGSMVDNLIAGLPGILAGAAGNGGLSLDVLKDSLLQNILGNGPLPQIQAAVRAAQAISGRTSNGDYSSVVGLAASILRGQLTGTANFNSTGRPVSNTTGNYALKSATDLMKTLKIGDDSWIDLIGGG